MKKPDPRQSRIREMFLETLANVKKPDELEALKYVGPQVFTQEDVNATSSKLDRLVRQYFVDNHISEEYFSEKYKLFALKEYGTIDPTKSSNNKSNLMKALKTGHITFRRFLEAVCSVMDNIIKSITIVITDPTGKSQTLQCTESDEFVKEYIHVNKEDEENKTA